MNKNDSQKSFSAKKLLSGKGFALTVCLSAAVVGAAGYIAYSSTASRLKSQLEAMNETTPAVTETAPPYTDVGAVKTDVPTVAATTEPVTEPAAPVATAIEAAASAPFIRPLLGEITAEFSGGELVKSKTLNLWQTHDGVDIAADFGEKVKSMTSGRVTKIYEDPMWGVTVIIDHGNGYEGHYCNLGETVTVKLDETVSAGTVIGTVGDSAECELGEVSHLHFGLKKNGEWVDPIATISPQN